MRGVGEELAAPPLGIQGALEQTAQRVDEEHAERQDEQAEQRVPHRQHLGAGGLRDVRVRDCAGNRAQHGEGQARARPEEHRRGRGRDQVEDREGQPHVGAAVEKRDTDDDECGSRRDECTRLRRESPSRDEDVEPVHWRTT